MRKITMGLALLLFSLPAMALEKDDEDALKDTQKLLSDQQAMDAFAKDNKDATHALDQVNEITHGNKSQQVEIDNISSSVFEDMVKDSGGDSVAIQSKLQQALKDPNAFMKTLPTEQQNRIRGLASEIDKQNANNQAPAATTTK